MIGLVHHQFHATRRHEGLTCHGDANLVDFNRFRFLDCLLPHVQADVGGFHRIIGHDRVSVGDLVLHRPLFVHLHEGIVLRCLDAHEVVPGGQVANQRLGVDAAQFFFAHREGNDRHIGRLETCVTQLFVERHVRVTVDGRDHRSLAARREFLDVGHNGLVITVPERGVDLFDVFLGNALALEERAQDLVGRAWIHIVGAEQEPALGRSALLAHQILHRRDRLLVGRSAGIKHILRELFAFVLNRIEEQIVELFKHGQHALARDRGPATKNRRDFVLGDQLTGLFGKQRPVRGRINDHGLELAAKNSALGVEGLESHHGGVLERGLRDGHRAGERVQDADFDR